MGRGRQGWISAPRPCQVVPAFRRVTGYSPLPNDRRRVRASSGEAAALPPGVASPSSASPLGFLIAEPAALRPRLLASRGEGWSGGG